MKLRTVIVTVLMLAIFSPFFSLPITSSQSTSTTTTMTISQATTQGQCTVITLAFVAQAGQIITGTYGSDASINFYILAPNDLNAIQNCRLNPSAKPLFTEEQSVGHGNPYRTLSFPTSGTYYFVFVLVTGQAKLTQGYATVQLTFPSSIVIMGSTGSVSVTSTILSPTSTTPVTSPSTSISTSTSPQTSQQASSAASTSTVSLSTESMPASGFQLPASLLLVLGGVIVVVGGLIGFTLLKNRKRRALSNFLTKIDSTYNEFAVDREECRTRLERLKHDAIEMLNSGSIDEGHFLMLDEKISEYLKEIAQATPKPKPTVDRALAGDADTQTATQIKYCKNCGAKLSFNDKVCKKCGVVQ